MLTYDLQLCEVIQAVRKNRVTTGYSTSIVRVWVKVGSAQHAVYNHMACMAPRDTVASVSVPTHLTHHHLCAKRRDPEMRAGDLFNERRARLQAKPSVFSPDTSSVLLQQSKHATNARDNSPLIKSLRNTEQAQRTQKCGRGIKTEVGSRF